MKEEAHSKWDKDNFEYGKDSARSMPIGMRLVNTLIDKVIMPVNICPHCKSTNTFHARVQTNKDFMTNVYRAERVQDQDGSCFMKFDFCFECSREFLIEAFFYKREVLVKQNKED